MAIKFRNTHQEVVEAVIKYLGGLCIYCNSEKNLHVHHILPLSRGGKNEMGNLELVCFSCHLTIHRLWKKFDPLKKYDVSGKCVSCGASITTKIKSSRSKCKFCRTKLKPNERKHK